MGTISIVRASAGSGKTYRLAYEYISRVVDDPMLYRHILAVTFTNKATEEMKRRIIGQINALANGERSDYLDRLQKDLGLSPAVIRERAARVRTLVLHDYSHFTVLTIDKFFQRILRAFLKELGLDLNFTLELQTDTLLEGAADRLIEELPLDAQLREWVVRFVEERLEGGKRWDIRREITDLGGELFAERYTARTEPDPARGELARIAEGAAAKATELRTAMERRATTALDLLREHNLSPKDFLQGTSGVMGYFVKISEGRIEPYGKRVQNALDSEDKWLKKGDQQSPAHALVSQLRQLLSELCATYDANIRFLKTAALVQENFRRYALLSDLRTKVDQLCAEQSLLPISKTGELLSSLVGGNDAPFIYEKAGNAYSHFLIDEFQDTSRRQWDNFVPLLDNALAQTTRSPVLLVGDVKQSIYRWRGGEWQILGSDAAERFGGAHEETLETNWRSAATVVHFNNALITRCVSLDNAALNAMLDDARQRGLLSSETEASLRDMLARAYTEHAQQPCGKEGGYVRLTLLDETKNATPAEPDEKPVVIALVEELQQRGFPPEQIAVLVRNRREGETIATLLLDYKAAHPASEWCYDLVTQEALTIGSAPVSGFIAAALTLSVSADDAIARAVFNRFRSLPLAAPLEEADGEFIRSLRLLPLEEAFQELLLHYKLHLLVDQIAYLQAMQDQVQEFASTRIADIPLFLAWWQEKGREQSISLPERSRALTILTIHKSKGLEFGAVIVPFADWQLTPRTNKTLVWAAPDEPSLSGLGRMPLSWKKEIGESHFSEEYYRESVLSHVDNLNLLYVAVTRAREELHLVLHKSEANRINALIREALPAGEGAVEFGDLTGNCTTEGGRTVYSFGEPVRRERLAPQPQPAVEFPLRRNGSKLRLRFDSQRYLAGDEPAPALSPRSQGMLMHRLFEQIDDHTQIAPRIDEWRREGLLSQPEAEALSNYVGRALADPTVAEWFSPGWEVVRNERGIVVPGSTSVRRPDRVLTRGVRAVVIDYKFGTLEKPAYAAQLREYMDLLRRMGYRDVQGYLWYVTNQTVRPVE